jgi:dephospho-CoA kinase
MIIGLTGKYCAGKNYIAVLLEARGLPVLDVDKLGYQTLEIRDHLANFNFRLRHKGYFLTLPKPDCG